MMRFSTEHLRKVFEDADKYENFKKLTYNLDRLQLTGQIF